ncbi:MAG: diaminopimelate decarboxylase [Phycisphaerae bacterium]|nr:diaminopimelate decarboxylase [Phycisphaerae bacterium]
MDYFAYRNGSLFCEDVPVADIATKVGTPVYVYSAATLRHHYGRIAAAFAELSPMICYSIKSLSNVHVLRLLRELGSGFDVVSGGELVRAQAAGGEMSKVVFAGVAKTDAEIRQAIDAGIGLFNIESEQEFENVARLCRQAGRSMRAALRVNPDIDPKTHRYTSTGKKESKFGVDIERAERFFQTYGRVESLRLDAIHLHIGSPIYTADPYVEAVTKTLAMMERLRGQGFVIRTLDIGGGFAADYEAGKSPDAATYAAAIVPLLRGRGLEVILEPGRSINANAGVLLAGVLYVKQGGERNFVIVDAAMTDLIRPALYGSEHFVWPAKLAAGETSPPRQISHEAPGGVKVDVVGGVCESSDFLAKDRTLPPMQRGDLLTIFTAGAYGFVMSNQYNSRPRAAEVLVDGTAWRVIRRRETYEDILAAEITKE